MKEYAIIEHVKNGNWFAMILKAETEEEAIKAGENCWNRLCPDGRNQHDFFAVVFGDIEDCYVDIVERWA